MALSYELPLDIEEIMQTAKLRLIFAFLEQSLR